MSEHTPEPWTLMDATKNEYLRIDAVGYARTIVVERSEFWQGFKTSVEYANFRRIVACVNVCRGLSIETLETFGETVPNGIAYHLQSANAEVARLRETLNKIDEYCSAGRMSAHDCWVVGVAREALSKGE